MEVIVLGTAQDGGIPQLGCSCPHCSTAWEDPSKRRLVASLAMVDHAAKAFWLIDATPDITEQLHLLTVLFPNFCLKGILLTHAHTGHYLGLASLGREGWNQDKLPVLATSRMVSFLRINQPWQQLIELGNIVPFIIEHGHPFGLGTAMTATAILVPHRDELSDTVAFRIAGPSRQLVYCPDIDRWKGPILELIKASDLALVDGTFYSDDELPGRDLTVIPHPRVVDSVTAFAGWKTNIHFIHLNHSNPLLRDEARVRELERQGFGIARRGQRFPL